MKKEINFNNPDWKKIDREELMMLSDMVSNGWIPKFHDPDIAYDRITPDNIPSHDVRFSKGRINIWKCRDGWQVTEVQTRKDGEYHTNHRGECIGVLIGFKGNRFVRGYIPDLKTVLELDEKGDL